MKLSVLALGALAASAAATPIRIITFSEGPVDASVSHHGALALANPKPCGGKHRSPFPGPLGALISRLGLGRHSNDNHHAHADQTDYELSQVRESMERKQRVVADVAEMMKHRVEEFVGGGKMVPVLEGGMVRILPFEEDDSAVVQSQTHGWKHKGDHHEQDHHSHDISHGMHRFHHRPHSFSGRLHRAMRNLRPTEALALAFVLGAGLGSIIHFCFMVLLLTVRRFQCRGMTREERRARRHARREERRLRKEERRAAREGRVRLECEDSIVRDDMAEGEVLPRTRRVRRSGLSRTRRSL
ncbi:hypothetical protein EHS25_005222 [Saitozyma podzolica]|uniref:Copper transporter n=1 Tax=Saitozyma podzolica TaxID=1890683 RepID=A0A427XYU9_9TREE|nr:hypothetical protein EHS25_005222 [Saitozyma podzolica]